MACSELRLKKSVNMGVAAADKAHRSDAVYPRRYIAQRHAGAYIS